MGIKESRPENPLEGLKLPVINKKYEILTALGEGDRGGIYKVMEKKVGKIYALKCVPIEPDPLKPNLTKETTDQISTSIELEKKALESINNNRIVQVMGDFTLKHPPSLPKKKRKKKTKCKTRCLLMEYCHGVSLESAFDTKLKEMKEKQEKELRFKKPVIVAKPSEVKIEEKKEDNAIDKDLTLFYFIKVLEVLDEVHTKHDINHGNLKPKHILLNYQDDRRLNEFKIKITGFGTSFDENPKVDMNVIYLSPERIVKSKAIDAKKADIWSLGIILLQMFSSKTSEDVIKFIKRLCKKVEESVELSKEFCDRYRVKTVNEDFVKLLHYLYETNLFITILDDFGIKDTCVREILTRMLCSDIKKRFSTTDLLNHEIIKTWKFFLTDDLFIDNETGYSRDRKSSDEEKNQEDGETPFGMGGSRPPGPPFRGGAIGGRSSSKCSNAGSRPSSGLMAISTGGMKVSAELDALNLLIPVDDDDEEQFAEDHFPGEDEENRRLRSLDFPMNMNGMFTLMKMPDYSEYYYVREKKKRKNKKIRLPNRMLSKCIRVMKKNVKNSLTLQYDDFMSKENEGTRLVFEKFDWKSHVDPSKNQYLLDVIEVLVTILTELRVVEDDEGVEKMMKQIVKYFKEFGCSRMIENVLKPDDDDDDNDKNKNEDDGMDNTYQNPMRGLMIDDNDDDSKKDVLKYDSSTLFYFIFKIAKYSQTIRCKLLCHSNMIVDLLTKMDNSNECYVKAIFHLIVRHLKVAELEELLNLYPHNDITFFKKCMFREHVFQSVIRRLFMYLGTLYMKAEEISKLSSSKTSKRSINGSTSPETTQKKKTIMMMDMDDEFSDDSITKSEEEEVIECLNCIIYQVQEFDPSFFIHPLKLHFIDDKIPSETRLEISRKNVDDWRKVDIQPLRITCLTKEEELIEMMSQNPLFCYKQRRHGNKNLCIGYYELDVENGGFKDDLYFGFRAMKMKPFSVCLHAKSGIIEIVDYSTHNVVQKHIPPVSVETNSTIGCGMTNEGSVFFTKDNRVIHQSSKFIEMNILSSDLLVPIHVSVKFNGNFEFKSSLNFGRVPFRFQFEEVKPQIEITKEGKVKLRRMKKYLITKPRDVNKERLKCISESDPGGMLRGKIRKKFQNNELIQVVLDKVDSLEKYFKEHDFDEDLQEMYNQESSKLVNIDQRFVLKKRSVREKEEEEIEGEDENM